MQESKAWAASAGAVKTEPIIMSALSKTKHYTLVQVRRPQLFLSPGLNFTVCITVFKECQGLRMQL